MMFKQYAAMAIATLALACPSGNAQVIESVEVSFPTMSTTNASYGARMSANGNWLAIAADYEAVVNSGEGEVYLYNKTNAGWVLRQLIKAPDGFAGNHYGLTVVMGQRRLLVGAPYDNEAGLKSGAVYVYRLDQTEWVFEEKIISPWENPSGLFGLTACFGTEETEVVIGAYFESLISQTSGATYVYRRTGGSWSFVQRLIAPEAPPAAYFGRSVAVSGDNLVIGASGYRPASNQSSQGAVVLYQRDPGETTWTFKELIPPPEPQAYQTFGEWLDINDSTVAVGSPGFNGPVGRGVVNTFRIDSKGSLEHLQRIDPPSDDCDSFGFPCTFSPSGNRMLISGYNSSLDIEQEGVAYVFQLDESGWDRPVRLQPSISGFQNFFGLSATFDQSGDEIFVSAPRCNGEDLDSGAVFRFRLEDCTENGVLDAWDIASGAEQDLNEDGIPDSCQGVGCTGDFNGDGLVNGSDMGLLLSVFGSTDPPEGTDLNGDNYINGADLGLLFSAWGSCK